MPARAVAETPELIVSLPDLVSAVVGPVLASEASAAETPAPATADQLLKALVESLKPLLRISLL